MHETNKQSKAPSEHVVNAPEDHFDRLCHANWYCVRDNSRQSVTIINNRLDVIDQSVAMIIAAANDRIKWLKRHVPNH